MFEAVEKTFREIVPRMDYCSLRLVRERSEALAVRRDVVQPVRRTEDLGAMITVHEGGGLGYGATPDPSASGLRQALAQALYWAQASAGCGLIEPAALSREPRTGEYRTRVVKPWSALSLEAKLDLLRRECARLKTDPRIVEWEAEIACTEIETLYLTAAGTRIFQQIHLLVPSLKATAHRLGESQTRSLGWGVQARQGGLEVLDEAGYCAAAPRLAGQALELLDAPNCPSGTMDLVLAPDQMFLQIHESVGHPLELDRILGDERNFAGRSFVTPDMFGSYRYGSELLNVTFDPTRPEEVASYAYDDEGLPASREYLIQDGILLRPLGGRTSQTRAGLHGVANSRASSWNRPAIDRMANVNLEPGESTFADLIGAVEHGIYMETNWSWSIDDSRNKFQFGCEWGRLIENGELTTVVRNPNYRGISAEFWRSLDGVGNAATVRVMGAAYCGKGEPQQMVRSGHAAPPCLFRNVAVFGGE